MNLLDRAFFFRTGKLVGAIVANGIKVGADRRTLLSLSNTLAPVPSWHGPEAWHAWMLGFEAASGERLRQPSRPLPLDFDCFFEHITCTHLSDGRVHIVETRHFDRCPMCHGPAVYEVHAHSVGRYTGDRDEYGWPEVESHTYREQYARCQQCDWSDYDQLSGY